MAVPLSTKADTLHNRVQEFIDTELMHTSPKYKAEVYKNIAEFIVYCKSQRQGRDVSREAIIGYVKLIHDKYNGGGHVVAVVGQVKRFLTWMFRVGYTTIRWHEYFPRLRSPPQGDVKIILQSEYMAIRKACYNKDQEWIAILGYSTGMRMGDCCTLKWSHVDMEKQTIRKLINKNRHNTGAYVLMPYGSGSDLHNFIVDLWSTKDDVFISEDNPVCPSMYLSYMASGKSPTDSFQRIFQIAGVTGRTFRHFRSTFESRIANSGMNMALAAKITGRTDVKSLLRYIQPDMEVVRDGVAKALELHTTVKGFA